MNTSNERLSINIRTGYKDKIKNLAHSEDIPVGDLLIKIFEAYETGQHLEHNHPVALNLNTLNIDNSLEIKEVKDALTNSGLTLIELVKEGLLQRARYYNSIAIKQADFKNMSTETLKNSTVKGAANYRIENAVQTLINHNNNQPEKDNKVCITKGMIFKLTGSNRQTINKYFDEQKIGISDHNNKHSLTEDDNRKGKGFDFKALIGWSE